MVRRDFRRAFYVLDCEKTFPQIQSLVLAHGRRWDEEMKGERRRAGGSLLFLSSHSHTALDLHM